MVLRCNGFYTLLRGPKRLLMTMGGEYQEQMDLDFWFIVGTPPRNVLEFKQLWQGGARWGSVGIGILPVIPALMC